VRYVSVGVCLACLAGPCRPLGAQQRVHVAHVRAVTADVAALLEEAANRSATVRTLIEEVEQTNVIVYVRARLLATQTIDGRIGFLGATPRTRFLAIELACVRTRDHQIATLAHELQHAAEIARAPWVVDAPTLAQYYAQIGGRVDAEAGVRTFETDAARTVAARVRLEIRAGSPAAERR
jgi:hypothetical protein